MAMGRTIIQATDAVVGTLSDPGHGDAVQTATDQMAQRVTAERITAQQDHVKDQHQRTHAHAEGRFAGGVVHEP